MKQVINHAPRFKPDVTFFEHLKNLILADNLQEDRPIEMILGVEVFSSILKQGVRTGKESEPVAQETEFGWLLSGRIGQNYLHSEETVSSLQVTCLEKLDRQLKRFWEIEEIPPRHFLSPDDSLCEEIFNTATVRKADGRYQVKIPFRNDTPDLGDSYQKALVLYQKLESRLNRDPALAKNYHEFLQEYLSLGHMQPDTHFSDMPILRYFLPHHPVIRESSTTTKLRVVFNASARSQNGNSLNDCMFVGPKLQQELFDIILRWRMHRYVYSADIEKMFRQIPIASADTPYQCILWKPPGSEIIKTFRLTTVTYGTAAAPYLSMRVLKQLAIDEANRFPNAAPVLMRDIYVDDIVFGADTLEECKTIRDELITLLRSGGFPLRKWESNCESLLEDLPDELRALKAAKRFNDASTKVLGVQWHCENDHFSFDVKLQHLKCITKRNILSIISSIFDPLGWVSPSVIVAKIFIQRLWRKNLDWDAELPDDLRREWSIYFNELSQLSNISIPRWVGSLKNDRKTWELHAFADASTLAYAAVVYLKCQTDEGSKITLLTSKTRVAPVKELTVPRLELNAAVLLAELLARVRGTLNLHDAPTFCWSDSSIVLAWIQTCPSKLKQYVANRVWKILESAPNTEWKHVPTDSNPADVASRGISPKELQSHALWWSGPEWLTNSKENWPQFEIKEYDQTKLELKTSVNTASKILDIDFMAAIARRFSSWPKLLRITAIFKRRISLSINRRDDAEFPYKQLEPFTSYVEQSSKFWLKYIQSAIFVKEIELLKKGKELPQGNLKSIDAFLDSDGLIRAGGRLKNAPIPYSVAHPIVLGRHFITDLIIRSIHNSTLHGGPQLMLRVLREKFWIFRARDQVRACVNKCVTCVRHRATPSAQKMGDLPSDRVTPSRPFSKTGVDYCGPFLVRPLPGRGRASRKGYISVFVCLVTKAVHLEFVSDCTTEAFLAAFKRFISRYGLPSVMRSDNGTNFQGAERELRETINTIRKDVSLASWFATENVEWRFTPPGAPNFGGIWEAAVKSVKHHLRRVINKQVLTFEEMCTLLAQISACLNSRPIAPMSDHIDDFSFLTPSHFLSCGPVLSIPELDLCNENENRLSRWKRVQQMRDQFWRLWRHDYLLQLQMRRKWQSEFKNLTVGDIVLIRSDIQPPCKWELGRVIKCFPGKDDLVRVVQIKTAKSTFNRAVNKICLLPLRSTTDPVDLEK